MTQLLEKKNVYTSSFEKHESQLESIGPAWLHALRNDGIAAFSSLGFPTTREESWRFTNIAPLTRIPFTPVLEKPAPPSLGRLPFDALDCHRLVCLDGHYASELSTVGDEIDGSRSGGVRLGGLLQAAVECPDLVEPHLGKYAEIERHPFASLNSAFLVDGVFLHIPDGAVVEKPIHVVFVSSAGEPNRVSCPRTLILAGKNSQARVVETYVGANDGVYFTNAVTEIAAADNAVLDHIKLQSENRDSFHIANVSIRMSRSSSLMSTSISLGAALCRNNINAILDGEGVECVLNGLYMCAGTQLVDNHTRIEHARPHSSSHELYKGVLGDKSSAVFNGRIYVHPKAQKTDAKQSNKNLLLSKEATVNTNPELEIFADDVKCTHGATIGNIDEEALFYLRTRGIDRTSARGILTYGFASEVVDLIKSDPIRAELEEIVFSKLPRPHDRGATSQSAGIRRGSS